MQTLNVKLENGNTLEVRQGDAAKLIEKKCLERTGTIASVVDFYKKRKETFNSLNSHVFVDSKSGKVTLHVEDGVSVPTATITGILEQSPWIAKLRINLDATWSPQELLKVIRLSRMAFATSAEQATMAQSLANISGNIINEFATADDFKGNTEQKKLTKLTTDLRTQFVFRFSPYIGYEKEDVEVEFQLVTENGNAVKILMVSPKLAEYLDEKKELAIGEAVDEMSELPLIFS